MTFSIPKLTVLEAKIDFKKLSNSYSFDNESLIYLPISGKIFWDVTFTGFESLKFVITVSGIVNGFSIMDFNRLFTEIPQDAANKIMEFNQSISIPRELLKHGNATHLKVSLSYTHKHEGEMGVSQSLEENIFYSCTFPKNQIDYIGGNIDD